MMSSLINQSSSKTKMVRWLISLVAGTSTLLAVAGMTPVATAAFSAGEVHSLSNSARAANGVGALGSNGALSSAAYAKAQHMFANNYWAHTSPSGVTGWTFIQQSGYSYSKAGENLAQGYGSASAVVSAWLASPSHRANLLNGVFTEEGIAVVGGTLGGKPTILVVAMYGRPSGYVAPRPAPAPAPAPSPAPAPAPTPRPATVRPTTAVPKTTGSAPSSSGASPMGAPLSQPVSAEQASTPTGEAAPPASPTELPKIVQTISQAPEVPANKGWLDGLIAWAGKILKALHI